MAQGSPAQSAAVGTARRLLILDSATLYYRAFYGLPTSMTAPHGHPNNAVRGFFDGLVTLSKALTPTHLICAWDNDWRPQFRVDQWPAYKRHRVADGETAPGAESTRAAEAQPDELTPQVAVIHQLLAAAGISCIGVDGFEADDVIASMSDNCDISIDIVSSDRDLIQCVNDASQVRLVSIARGLRSLDYLDAAAVTEKYGVTPGQYVDFATLRGDTSDGIPGVPGIGEVTAARIIRHYGSLDAATAAAFDGTWELAPGLARKLNDAADSILAMREVLTARRDVLVPESALAHSALPTRGTSGAADTFAAEGVSQQYTALVAAGIITN